MNKTIRSLFELRFNPGKDLLVVLLSWILVTGTLYTASVIIGAAAGGGLPYFFLYGILAATIFGIGIPVGWMVIVRKRPLADLGFRTRFLVLSLLLQVVFAGIEYIGGLSQTHLPALDRLLPLVALSLAIGLFEAIFWRGWVLLRLEEAFGFLPALLIGSALYALYHIGYGMPASEMIFLFFIGVMYAVAFRLTKNIFILWPFFQPMGQLITLLKDGLDLPVMAAVGFGEVLLVMGLMIWFANRYYHKRLVGRNLAVTVPETV